MQKKFLVSASNGKALYDLGNGKVFRLDKREAKKFKKFEYKKEDLKHFLKELSLKQVNLEITSNCNLKCSHCYGSKEFGSLGKELSTKKWKEIIEQVSEFNPKFLLFTGGEPLLREDFNELLLFAQNLALKTSLFSNLISLSDKTALLLKKTNSVVQFSCFGHNSKIHDSITGVEGSFESQKKALKKLRKLGVPLKGQIILLKQNLAFQNQIRKHFQKMQIPIEFSIARPSGNQTKEGIPGCQTCSFPQDFVPKNVPVSITPEFFALKHFFNDCWIQRGVITSKGKVIACPFARNKVLANLNKQPFSEAIKAIKENAANFKIDKINGCKNCSLRFACSDCRPWALSLTKNSNTKNPYCKEF